MSLHASSGVTSRLEYGHLISTMPFGSSHAVSTTHPSGDAPSQPCFGWIMKPHFSTVTFFLHAMYFCIAVLS